MSLKAMARRALKAQGYEIYNTRAPNVYSEDMFSTCHNHSFIQDAEFQRAYARGVKANNGFDHHIRWRAHVALWVASQAARRPGSFVECGVSTGFLASAIMEMLNWRLLDRDFYLFDTWAGLDKRFMSETELQAGRTNWYSTVKFEKVKENFSEFGRAHMIQGAVPETLTRVNIDQVAYLSLDMNCTAPEIAAAEHFWPRLVPGGMMLLDDYTYSGYEEQHVAFNEFAKREDIKILALPTGQGLAVKI